MNRTIQLALNKVSPTPHSLRLTPSIDKPTSEAFVNLGQLFQHYYFDSFPTAPPKPDPSRFEYLELISAAPKFQFLPFVKDASLVKKRALSTEMGQAFCRWILSEHFGINYFAHMSKVLGKPTHAAFDGMKIKRIAKGDVPDYLCARSVTKPRVAEAKGRFSSVGFNSAEFQDWREQFTRIEARDKRNVTLQLKGYISATRFSTEDSSSRIQSGIFVEDPNTIGERDATEIQEPFIGRVIVSMHYAQIFRKLDLLPLASALDNGAALANELSFQVPIWTCFTEPFLRREFIGGFYQTLEGHMPNLTKEGWQMPLQLGQGHACFIGLELSTALTVAKAARGNWNLLDDLATVEPSGIWNSDFSWLRDGSVIAPLIYFLPTGAIQL